MASIILTIKDSNGNLINNVKKNASNGSGRIAWNLRHKSYYPIRSGSFRGGWGWSPSGPYATPGDYQAELFLENNGSIEKLDGPINFSVRPLREGTLKELLMMNIIDLEKEFQNFILISLNMKTYFQ